MLQLSIICLLCIILKIQARLELRISMLANSKGQRYLLGFARSLPQILVLTKIGGTQVVQKSRDSHIFHNVFCNSESYERVFVGNECSCLLE